MQIEKLNIEEIVPYTFNAKLHPQHQIEQIISSIEEFGMDDPIAIDKNNVIIEGHGRLMALKQMGVKEVECIRLSHLTDEQKKAYTLVHNKLTMNTDFDISLLEDELKNIYDIDMEEYGFDVDFDIDIDDKIPVENHRNMTYKKYNLEFVDNERVAGFYQMPIIKKENYIPTDLIGFNYCINGKNKKAGIHCFIDDYQFERLWTSPLEYVEAILEYECFLSPDFSLYSDMPMAMKIWNVYRSRLIGQIMQDSGVTVIPTVSWAESETFAFCFDGIEKGSVVAISTIGVKQGDTNFIMWKSGVDEMIKRLAPTAILCYGGEVDYDFGGAKVIHYKNHNTERLSDIKSEKNLEFYL